MKKIVLSSSNPGKLKEFRQLFEGLKLQFIAQSDFNIQDVAEIHETFLENALLKARHAARYSKLAALADDSGLCVPALKGQPGVYSARFSGTREAKLNNQKLLEMMQTLAGKDRSAYFCCTLVYIETEHDPMPLVFQGVWHGEILTQPEGEEGFGYDPIFYLPNLGKTAAQLPLSLKNKLSHRAKATRDFLAYWKEQCV